MSPSGHTADAFPRMSVNLAGCPELISTELITKTCVFSVLWISMRLRCALKCVRVHVGKIDLRLNKSRCTWASEQARTHTHTHTHTRQQEYPSAYVHNHTHSHYSGGRLIEGYNWGVEDERLSAVICEWVNEWVSVCVCVCARVCVRVCVCVCVFHLHCLPWPPHSPFLLSLSLSLCPHPKPSQNVQPCRYLQSH